jgi:hypothetical protein
MGRRATGADAVDGALEEFEVDEAAPEVRRAAFRPGMPPDDTAVDGTWRVIELSLPVPGDTSGTIQLELLRPPEWLEATQASPGRQMYLVLDELGIRAHARVVSIRGPPIIRLGPGRVVLSTMTRVSEGLLELYLDDDPTPLVVTSGHPLHSADVGTWVNAGALRPGDRLTTATGSAVVRSVTKRAGPERVFNLEVATEHEYYVGPASVLAHNTALCGNVATRGGVGPVLKGQAGVDRAVAGAQARGETVLGREITIETAAGRTRPDLLTRTPEGNLRFIECKNGPCAAVTTRQRQAFPLIESQGGIPRGGNAAAAGLEPGVPIGPTEVLIERFP